MSRAALPLALLLAAGCGGPGARPSAGPAEPAGAPVPAPPPEVADPNFELIVSEIVPGPEQDGLSYTAVYVDGQEAGKTAGSRRSEEKRLRLKLPAGNQPVRLEHWVQDASGAWTKLEDSRQPRERFVRVDPATIARLTLRFSAGAGSHTLTLSRDPR